MLIRLATHEDIDHLVRLYDVAQNYMISSGNPSQWGKDYPSLSLIQSDITSKHCWVMISKNKIVGAFAAITGIDNTYSYIEDGEWIDNTLPYTTLHRIASNGSQKGIFTHIINWCDLHWNNLRIDTHQDNLIMQHLIDKHGFRRCGIIYTRNHSPRIAYQRLL